MNGSKCRIECITPEADEVLKIVKKQPKRRGSTKWYADPVEEMEWVVKQSELHSFAARLLRSNSPVIIIRQEGWK